MGIIKAAHWQISGLEVMEADNMGDQTVFACGVKIRRGSNMKGTDNTVSNGSVIHVYPNQFMMVMDGGKVVDYTAEEGYYTVDNSSMPSLFNGQFKDTLKESFNRIRYGGETPTAQFQRKWRHGRIHGHGSRNECRRRARILRFHMNSGRDNRWSVSGFSEGYGLESRDISFVENTLELVYNQEQTGLGKEVSYEDISDQQRQFIAEIPGDRFRDGAGACKGIM